MKSLMNTEVEVQLRLSFSSRGLLLDIMKLSRVALRLLEFLLFITICTIYKNILVLKFNYENESVICSLVNVHLLSLGYCYIQ